jgi:hypothetical protein
MLVVFRICNNALTINNLFPLSNKNIFSIFRHALDGLYNNLHRINDDLAQKNNSLDLDNKCMDVRQKLNTRPQTTMERNLTLTGIERERSKILA